MLINFIRHQVTLGLVDVQKIATQDNVADVLTKPLSWKEFAPKAARLLGIPEDEFTQDTGEQYSSVGGIIPINMSFMNSNSY